MCRVCIGCVMSLVFLLGGFVRVWEGGIGFGGFGNGVWGGGLYEIRDSSLESRGLVVLGFS